VCGFEGNEVRFELGGLVPEQFDVLAGGEPDYVEAVRVGAYDVEGLAADAAGGAQDGKATPHECADVSADLIQARRYSIPRGQ
jgi:hypothetical protein